MTREPGDPGSFDIQRAVMNWDVRVAELRRRFDALVDRLSDPVLLSDRDAYREVAQQHAELAPVIETAGQLESARRQLAEARELVETSSEAELVELAEGEVAVLAPEVARLEAQLRRQLLPKDPLADRSAVVEIRAGTGGDEAGLFAADLFRMYTRYADRAGWSIEVVDLSEGERGAYKEVVFIVRGRNAYGDLRHESGVHRVQRVPATESQGRIHTSAATVAVLPEAEEVDVAIAENDLRVDVYRSSGPGGQSVNTTDSAVRITHLPTGLVVTCQDEKSQLKNKVKALKVLRSRLLDLKVAAQEAERSRERRTMVGTGDRSAKIRTYNFPQGRVTDHRIGLTLHRLQEILDGDLEELIGSLRQAHEAEQLETPAVA
ncbi:MAG TPA: peptide chain release factor 1 [Longimicrobiales bacterium]|nr:peptide chain release factor 1 [Longimicrobiales bacterium]